MASYSPSCSHCMTTLMFSFVAFLGLFGLILSEAQSVPAMYVFGDSLVDVGNNNYIEGSLLKANYPFNGIDYPGGKPTGRFCNGKNAADFLGEKLGLPTAPPYLSNTSDPFLKGVSFASGGSGLFNTTGQGFLLKTLSLPQQVDYYTNLHERLVTQLGTAAAQQLLSKSLFAVVIGSNDLFTYSENKNSKFKNVPPQQYIDEMIAILQQLLKDLHGLGARKFVVVGLGTLGCSPARRHDSSTEDCDQDLNTLVTKYNQQLQSMMAGLVSNFNDINYTYFDTYTALFDMIQKPASYGFAEAKAACCGFGKLNADVFCTPLSLYCPNRTDHIFWDKVHPTQQTASLLVNMLYSGSQPHVTPMNVKQLIDL